MELTNDIALLSYIILSQEGAVKGLSDMALASTLIGKLPEVVGTETGWTEKPCLDITDKEKALLKKVMSTVTEKGVLAPTLDVLRLATALDFHIPECTPRVNISLNHITCKYLQDVLLQRDRGSNMGRIKRTDDLIIAAQTIQRLTKVPDGLEKLDKQAVKEWMETPVELVLTNDERDLCRKTIRSAVEDGIVAANRYVGTLLAAFGLPD